MSTVDRPTSPARVFHLAALAFAVAAPASAQCELPASIGGSGGVCQGVDVVGRTAYVVEHSRLTTFDLTDPAAPAPLGTVFLSGNWLWDVKVADGVAACADAFWGVRLVDVRDPRAPAYLGTYDTPYAPESVAIGGDVVYAADGQSSVRLIDISNPYQPTLLSSVSIGPGWYAQEVVLVGSTLYVGSEAYGKVGLRILDVSNPSAPVTLGDLIFTPGYPVGAGDLEVSGSVAYLTDTKTGLRLIDVSNPSAPVQVGSLPGSANAVKAFGSRLLVGRDANIDVVDVSNTAAPVVLGSAALPAWVDDIAFMGNTAVLGLRDAGLVTLDVSVPGAPTVLSTSRATNDPLDVAIGGGLAYVADGAYGLKVMDVSNPMTPALVGETPVAGTCYGLTLRGTDAYVAAGSAGLQVLDVQVPAAPAVLGGYDTPGTAVEVALSGNLAFVADGVQGLHVVDIGVPSAPTFVGQLSFPGVNANATSVFVQGNLVYATDLYYGLRIVDVSNPAAPKLVSTTDTYSYAHDVVVQGQLAYVVDYSKRLYVMDVSNPVAPVVLWSGPQNSSAKKLAIDGNLLFLSQNQGGYLETYDISVPTTPVLLHSVWAPTGGNGLAVSNGILFAAHGGNGLQTFRTDGLPYVLAPQAALGCPGGSAGFRAAAAGQTQSGGVALGYAWRRNGVPLSDGPTPSGSTVSGATTFALRIDNLAAADAGQYDCVVSNACGATTSASAPLALASAPCPVTYCAPKSGLLCGAPTVAYEGFPSASSGLGFELRAAPARGARLGILMYGDQGRAALPFQGGLLCVQGPRRSVPVDSGGTPGGCDGAFFIDVNAFARGQLGGNPQPYLQVAGTVVDAQWWGRDAPVTGSFLSAGLEFTVAP